MIDIKIIRKAKTQNTAGAVNTAATAYTPMAVKEAAHAARADLAERAKEADHAATADEAARAEEAQHAAEADRAKRADYADDADKWDGHQYDDCLDQPVRRADKVGFATVSTDSISSAARFADGLLGEGFRLWRDEGGQTYLCLDHLTVRQTMRVMELLIDKVRAVGGMICVSAANGKIKTAEKLDGYWHITFEQDNTFVEHDLMRCQTFTGHALKSYWVEVAAVEGGGILVATSEFPEYQQPEAGDECVLMGNTANAKRQNMVLISATDDGQPRVDVMDGVKSRSFSNALRARLGNLDGIADNWFPADNQPHGNGLYSDNAYLRGTFLLVTGEDVKTKFEITEGKINSTVEGMRRDFIESRGYLNNPNFDRGFEKWNTGNTAVFFTLGGKWIWNKGTVVGKHGTGAFIEQDQGRNVVKITEGAITQRNANLLDKPDIRTNGQGEKLPVMVYLAFFYKCTKAGVLTVEFDGVDKTGFEDFEPLHLEETMEAGDSYRQYNGSGLWNGTGDFRLGFTGEIALYMLILTNDKAESLEYRYRTLFEQSEKLIRIAALNFDKEGHVLDSSQIITTAKYNELISQRFNEDGTLKNKAGMLTTTDWRQWQSSTYSADMAALRQQLEGYVSVEAFAGMFATAADNDKNIVKQADIAAFVTKDADGKLESGVHIAADQIQLEGLVTANQNFKVLQDGSIETRNAKLSGYLYSSFLYIDKSDATALERTEHLFGTNREYRLNTNLYVNATHRGVVLPVDEKYEGARVLIMDSYFLKSRVPTDPTTVRTADGSAIVSGLFAKVATDKLYQADEILIDSGVVELTMQRITLPTTDEEENATEEQQMRWVLITNSCQKLKFYFDGTEYDCRTNL